MLSIYSCVPQTPVQGLITIVSRHLAPCFYLNVACPRLALQQNEVPSTTANFHNAQNDIRKRTDIHAETLDYRDGLAVSCSSSGTGRLRRICRTILRCGKSWVRET
jgi:hypothetical protein